MYSNEELARYLAALMWPHKVARDARLVQATGKSWRIALPIFPKKPTWNIQECADDYQEEIVELTRYTHEYRDEKDSRQVAWWWLGYGPLSNTIVWRREED